MKKSIACMIAMGIAILYSLGLIVSALSTNDFSGSDLLAQSPDYEGRIFDSSKVHVVSIEIPVESWEDLKLHALNKEYYDSTVTIDGEVYYHTGIRTKGNMTLMQTAMYGGDRYSLVVDFGAFDDSQRYHGLDKLVLNNSIGDASFLRDYLCYDLMRNCGVPAPLCSFTEVYLNGELLGLYSVVEGLDKSFAIRNFGYEHGCMYKPENMNIGDMLTGKEKDFMLDLSAVSGDSESVNPLQFLGVTDQIVGLQYLGDDPSNYSDIWDNAVFPIDEQDQLRLINAIRTVGQGSDVSEVLDVSTLLQYFAVNTFVANDDNYLSSQGHNYVLYEKDGRMMMLPWDYDHSLGTIGPTIGMFTMTEVVNLPIDEPLMGTTLAERPMLNSLLSNEEYKMQYEAILDEFLTEYVESGYLKNKIDSITNMLLPYIQNGPEEYFSEEKFHASAQSVRDFCNLRGASIRGQLAGSIPRTASGQKEHPELLIDGSGIISPDSGSMTDLLFPDNRGLYLEDFLAVFNQQINPFALLGAIPWTELTGHSSGDSGESFVQHMIDTGKIHDAERFYEQVEQIIKSIAGDIFLLISIPIVLIAMLIFATAFNKKHRPSPRQNWRSQNAV